MKAIITLQDINRLARACRADTDIAASLIAEAEKQDIKPKIGDALYLQLTQDTVPGAYGTLLDGGEWTQADGTTRCLTGLRTALAYYAYARIVRDGNLQSTRYGTVVKTEDNSTEGERTERQRQYREAFTTADGYMQEVMEYLAENAATFTAYRRKPMKSNRSILRVLDGPQCRPKNDCGPVVIDGAPGESAYQIWLDNGHTGSESDYLEWLRQPATSAAETALSAAKKAEEAAASTTPDTEMSDDSEKAVQNKVIKAYVDGIVGNIDGILDSINGEEI